MSRASWKGGRKEGPDPAAAVRALMEAGCPVAALSQPDNAGPTPLHSAVRNGTDPAAAVRALME
eukprot:SAG31_NODE_5237_length_2658_cov_4.569754_2_plen_63_part_01